MWLIFLSFYLVDCTLYPSNRCHQNNCSYQLPQASEGSCAIYNTSVCLETLSESDQIPVKDLDSEDNSKFTISVLPYIAEFKDSYSGVRINVSAVNLTFTIHQKEVDHFAVKITEGRTSQTKCRIFNYRNHAINISLPTNFFYDCFTKLAEFHLEFISLTTKEKLSYDVFIPPVELKSVCDWKPSIMIFSGSLPDRIVRIKFSQAPQQLNISAYDVKLIPMSSIEQTKVFRIPADQERNMLHMEFISAVNDYYTLQVLPLTGDGNVCLGEAVFYVGSSKFGSKMIILYVCTTLFILGTIVFLKYLCTSISLLESTFKPHVLLIHSVTTPEEKHFVSSFVNYLSIHGCKVSTIYGSAIDPLEWCEKKYAECDVIVFIISEGLFLTLDPQNFRALKVHHPYCKQLQVAGYIFHNQISQPNTDFREKKIAKVCFPFSKKAHIPEWMEMVTGKCYMLPKEMSAFLCFIFGCKLGVKCMKQHSSLFNSNIKHSAEYHELIDKMKAVPVSVEKDEHSSAGNVGDDLGENQQPIKDDSESDSQGCTDRTDPMPIIKALLNGSSTSIVVEPEVQMNPSADSQRLLKCEDSEFLKYLELLRESETESDFLLWQRVNKSMCGEEFHLCGESESDSLLNQIQSRYLSGAEELNLHQEIETSFLLNQGTNVSDSDEDFLQVLSRFS